MVEAGGPTTQGGIWYQNSVAALYMGDLLDLKKRPQNERVVEVRLEAPSDVDDVVVRYADGRRQWIQVKSNLRNRDSAWDKLWHDFRNQQKRPEFGGDDALVLILGQHTQLAAAIRECCDRSRSAENTGEWVGRLSKSQTQVVESIKETVDLAVTDNAVVFELLKRTTVEIIPTAAIDRDFAPFRIPESSVEGGRLLSAMRDLAGGGARLRGAFSASQLRARLATEHNISLIEPTD